MPTSRATNLNPGIGLIDPGKLDILGEYWGKMERGREGKKFRGIKAESL